MNWTAYCITCGKQLESCPNGTWAEAAARIHLRLNGDHRILVGYEAQKEVKP